jgi:hypothetical protein
VEDVRPLGAPGPRPDASEGSDFRCVALATQVPGVVEHDEGPETNQFLGPVEQHGPRAVCVTDGSMTKSTVSGLEKSVLTHRNSTLVSPSPATRCLTAVAHLSSFSRLPRSRPGERRSDGSHRGKTRRPGSGLDPAIQEINYRVRYPRQAELQGKRLVKPLGYSHANVLPGGFAPMKHRQHVTRGCR